MHTNYVPVQTYTFRLTVHKIFKEILSQVRYINSVLQSMIEGEFLHTGPNLIQAITINRMVINVMDVSANQLLKSTVTVVS